MLICRIVDFLLYSVDQSFYIIVKQIWLVDAYTAEFRSIIASYDLVNLLNEDSFNLELVQNIKDLQKDVLLALQLFPIRCLELVIQSQEYLFENLNNTQEKKLLDAYKLIFVPNRLVLLSISLLSLSLI